MAYTAPTFVNGQTPPLSAENMNALAQAVEDNQTFAFQNVSVATSAFVSDATFTDYPYRASIPLTGVTTAMACKVILSPTDANSGLYASSCKPYNGGLYIYASEVPETTLVISTIEAKVVTSNNGATINAPFGTVNTGGGGGLDFTASTVDITAGTTPLETDSFYFVYA